MNAPAVGRGRPSLWTWLLAAVELTAAFAVARLITAAGRTTATGHHHLSTVAWSWLDDTWVGLGAAGFGCWLLQRKAVAASAAAAAIIVFAASPAVRSLAAGSHLIAMVGLELVTVIFPLLALSVLPDPPYRPAARSWGRGWTVFAVLAALCYAGLLVVIHVPAVHHRVAELGAAPSWAVFGALAVAVVYWFAVLRTAGRIPAAMRRRLLVGPQELAALIGLVFLFGASAAMGHSMPLGMPAAWDQRLGGLVMIATCAAVTVPLVRRLR